MKKLMCKLLWEDVDCNGYTVALFEEHGCLYLEISNGDDDIEASYNRFPIGSEKSLLKVLQKYHAKVRAS